MSSRSLNQFTHSLAKARRNISGMGSTLHGVDGITNIGSIPLIHRFFFFFLFQMFRNEKSFVK